MVNGEVKYLVIIGTKIKSHCNCNCHIMTVAVMSLLTRNQHWWPTYLLLWEASEEDNWAES